MAPPVRSGGSAGERTPATAVSVHGLLVQAERKLAPPAKVKPPRPPPRAHEPSTISISLHDADVELIALGDASAHDAPAGAVDVDVGPHQRPSLARRIAARLLFVVILAFVVLLGAAELSVALHAPWLDPRPHLMRYSRLAGDKLRALDR